ncbi:MAG TPA: hypothetical protein VHC69_27140 [Polyangiaceae bacterium]|nr:hypothetical protein [Polyangiaceae bacterium]
MNSHTGWGRPLAMVGNPKGGVFVAGILSQTTSEQVPFVAFATAQGTVRWLRKLDSAFPSSPRAPRATAYALAPDREGGVYVLGGDAPSSVFLARLNAQGAVLWSGPVGGGDALVSTLGGVVVVGSVAEAGADATTEKRELLLDKRDDKGNQAWSARYKLEGPRVRVTADATPDGFVVATVANGVVEIGATRVASAASTVDRRCREDTEACPRPGNTAVLAAFMLDGTPKWVRSFGAPNAEVLPSQVRSLPGGSVALAGGFTGRFVFGLRTLCETAEQRPPRTPPTPPEERPASACNCEPNHDAQFAAVFDASGAPQNAWTFGHGADDVGVVVEGDDLVLLSRERGADGPAAPLQSSVRRVSKDGRDWTVLTPPPDTGGVAASDASGALYYATEGKLATIAPARER